LDKWETEELIEIPITALLAKGCFSEGIIIQNEEELTHTFLSNVIEISGEPLQQS